MNDKIKISWLTQGQDKIQHVSTSKRSCPP